MCCHLAWQDAAVMNSVDLHAMKKERVAGMLADDDTVYLKNAAKLPWPKHLQLCMSSWYSCAWDMQVQSENTPKQHCSCLECRQNSQNCFHLQFFCYSSSLVQNLRVLFDHNIWVQPPLYPGAMMGRGIGDEVSAWGHVQAARLPKGCCAGGRMDPAAWDRCAQPAVGPSCHCTSHLHGTWQLVMLNPGLNPGKLLAPDLPTVAWTLQDKPMNSRPSTGAKRSCNL